MRFLLAVSVLQLLALASGEVDASGRKERSVVDSTKSTVASAVGTASDVIRKVPILKDILPDCVQPEPVCPNVNITFWYYTNSTAHSPQKLDISDRWSGKLNNGYPWKVIIHGYTKSKDEIPNPQLRSAYFEHGEYNLISVDYHPIAKDGCYIQAVNNVPLIANCTAQMIDALIYHNYFTSDDLHIVGFSLGGQIAGLVSKYMTYKRPGRVTGLDPASPLFDGKVHNSLNTSAADFVDVMHTNAIIKGKLVPSGHVDFYVNGGISQPGCLKEKDESYSTCNHNRSPLYFAESINSKNGFWGIPCDSPIKFAAAGCTAEEDKLVQMGEFVPKEARGIYYLQTRSSPPFALGKKTKASLF